MPHAVTRLLVAVAGLAIATSPLAAQTAPPPPGPAAAGPAGAPPRRPPQLPSVAKTTYAPGLLIAGGHRGESSEPAAIRGGTVTDSYADGLAIRSARNNLNAVLVRDGSTYTLSNATIDLSGGGTDDFVGLGAGAMVTKGTLVLRKVRITTSGVISPAVVATEGGTLRVYDSDFRVKGGPLPAEYKPKIGAGMMQPPAALKLGGTSRASLTMNGSESFFYNSRIVADGWGALSTDFAGGYTYLEANNCDIQVLGAGYGTYADFGATVAINDSRMSAGSWDGIIAGAARLRFNNVTGRSDGGAVMIHSVGPQAQQEVGVLRITGGSFTTKDAGVLVKSSNADIIIDRASFAPANGVILQSVVNDDPMATKVAGATVPGIKAVLIGATLTGDINHDDPDRAMSVALSGTTLRGAIRNVRLSLDGASRWTATRDSSVTLADGADASRLDAVAGATITVHGLTGTDRNLASGGRLVYRS